ncbi:MAG: glycerophosphodiester phosphodiesterase family protein [Lachnospiraceae bacterium]|nr:glycerophosphodiester phosphodiesterase family protein [Lachnospiraceae bacterium]
MKKLWAVIMTVCLAVTDLSVGASAKGIKNVVYHPVAHRGDMKDAPEETYAAFAKAKQNGYGYFEVDIWKNKKGEWIATHDYNLRRMTGVNKTVRNLTRRNLKKYPIRQDNGWGRNGRLYILTFSQVVDWASRNNMKVFFHVKTSSSFTEKDARYFYRKLKKKKMLRNSYVFGQTGKVLHLLTEYKSMNTGFLTRANTNALRRKRIRKVNQAGADFILIKYYDNHPFTPSLMRYAHKKGIRVGTFSLLTKEQNNKFRDAGGDFGIANSVVYR